VSRRTPWCVASLERALRKVLVERGRIQLAALENAAAMVEWTENGPIKAKIDPLTSSQLSGAVHELAHPLLEKVLEPLDDRNGELAELAMDAWEAAICVHIESSPARKAWWRKAINRKLPARHRVR